MCLGTGAHLRELSSVDIKSRTMNIDRNRRRMLLVVSIYLGVWSGTVTKVEEGRGGNRR